jgi:hypothetical protein
MHKDLMLILLKVIGHREYIRGFLKANKEKDYSMYSFVEMCDLLKLELSNEAREYLKKL